MTAERTSAAEVWDARTGPQGLTRVCRLAEGGMGRVDLAIRRVGEFRRMYAVKRLHPHLATDPEFRAMFLDEARIAGRIRHPNVVGVLDVGEDEHGPFLVMDYVDGLPLTNLVRASRAIHEPMPVQVCVRIALDVARGLHAAHELSDDGKPLGLVHRDLSPQNVLVGFDGQARITDFGIAKALGRSIRTATGVLKGKLSYMSPEQIKSQPLDRRSDLFSLGIVLFEMLSGERLYKGDDAIAIVDGAPPDIGEIRSDVPDDLVGFLFELLARDRESRPRDAREVALRLESILAGLVADEEPIDVAAYVDLVAGEAKREQERVLAAAIEEAERDRADRARVDRVKPEAGRPRVAVVGLIAGAIGAAALVAIAWAPWGERSPSAGAPAAAAREVGAPARAIVPGVADDPVVERAIAAAPDAGPSLAADAGTTELAEVVAETQPARQKRARRIARRRPAKRAGAGAASKDGERFPDWVDFER